MKHLLTLILLLPFSAHPMPTWEAEIALGYELPGYEEDQGELKRHGGGNTAMLRFTRNFKNGYSLFYMHNSDPKDGFGNERRSRDMFYFSKRFGTKY